MQFSAHIAAPGVVRAKPKSLNEALRLIYALRAFVHSNPIVRLLDTILAKAELLITRELYDFLAKP